MCLMPTFLSSPLVPAPDRPGWLLAAGWRFTFGHKRYHPAPHAPLGRHPIPATALVPLVPFRRIDFGRSACLRNWCNRCTACESVLQPGSAGPVRGDTEQAHRRTATGGKTMRGTPCKRHGQGGPGRSSGRQGREGRKGPRAQGLGRVKHLKELRAMPCGA